MNSDVIFMEFSRSVMEVLDVYCNSVYLSTLSNPANQVRFVVWYVRASVCL